MTVDIVRWENIEGTDTLSYWIQARLLADRRPIIPNLPLEVFASDSVLHLVTFTPLNARVRPDTVSLRMQVR